MSRPDDISNVPLHTLLGDSLKFYVNGATNNLPRLFSDECKLSFVEKSLSDTENIETTVDSLPAWKEFLQRTRTRHVEHLCFIHQKYSWGRLILTQELMLDLISHYSICPSIWRVLSLFGTKIAPGRSSGRFFFRKEDLNIVKRKRVAAARADVDGYGLNYTLQYVEKHGRDLNNPWSIRQMAVHLQVDFERCFSCWIVIHANKPLQNNLSMAIQGHVSDLNAYEISASSTSSNHLIILASAIQNWGSYLDYLSSEFKKTNDRALICKIVKTTKGEDDEFEIGLQDMQWLQWLNQHLQTVRQKLLDNIDTVTGLQEYGKTLLRWYSHLPKTEHSEINATYTEFLNWLQFWRNEVRSMISESDVLIKQVQGCSELVYNILHTKDTEIIQQHGEMLNDISQRSNIDSQLILDLTIKSQRTARSMQVLTFITLIYLPPSFLATFFGMNFIIVESLNDVYHITVTKGMWLFGATAIPLTLITVGLWYLWDRRTRLESTQVCSSAMVGAI